MSGDPQWLKGTVYWKKTGGEDLGLILLRGHSFQCVEAGLGASLCVCRVSRLAPGGYSQAYPHLLLTPGFGMSSPTWEGHHSGRHMENSQKSALVTVGHVVLPE